MKKGILNHILNPAYFYIIILIVVCVGFGAAAKKVPKYWQDIILKPEQAWIEAYGYNNESILAYNVRSLIMIAKQQEVVISALKKELDALTDFINENVSVVNDPNDPNVKIFWIEPGDPNSLTLSDIERIYQKE